MPSQAPLVPVVPRQVTPRNHERATYGAHAAAVGDALGKPFIPWQRLAADVALEVDEAGRFVYSDVVVTVQRQCGKTTLDLATSTQNALMGRGRRAWYTAQSGQHATDKWREMVEDDWAQSVISPLARKPRLSNGSEALRFYNGSTFRPHPPTVDSLHSKQVDRASIDEAWAFSQTDGQALVQAIAGAAGSRSMVTGQRPQVWIESTEGTVDSTFLNAVLERARAGDPTVCLIDYGIGPDVDPTDLDAVAAAHPGYGYLFDMQTLVDNLQRLGPGEFARAYGNRRTGATERTIPLDAWKRAAYTDPGQPDGPIAFGAAVGVDNVDATIVVAVRVAGDVIVGVVPEGHAPGSDWVLPRLQQLSTEFGAPVAIDRVGPSGALFDAAERAQLDLVPLTSSAVTAAASNVLSWVTTEPQPKFRYRPHAALDAAAELATRRWIGDGAWTWGRRASVGSISALEAGTLAAWAVDHLPKKVGRQLF